jgi:hypothetical protein
MTFLLQTDSPELLFKRKFPGMDSWIALTFNVAIFFLTSSHSFVSLCWCHLCGWGFAVLAEGRGVAECQSEDKSVASD